MLGVTAAKTNDVSDMWFYDFNNIIFSKMLKIMQTP